MYDRKGYPTTIFNGGSIARTGMSDAEVDAAISKEWKKKVQFSVQLEGRFVAGSDGKKIDFIGTVDRLDNLAPDKLKYAFIAFENGFEEGKHVFNHVVRLIDPSAQGGSIRFGTESRKSIKRTIEMNADWLPEVTGFTFILWDSETLEVHSYSLWNYVSPHVVTDFTKPVSAGKNFAIAFDKDIDKDTVNKNSILLTTKSGYPVDFTAKVNKSTVTIEPVGGLVDGGEYALYLLGGLHGILSADVHPIDDNLVFGFRAELVKAPILSVPTKSVEFGSIKENASKTFAIENPGTDTLTGTLSTNEPFVDVDPKDFSIEPGSSQTVKVSVNLANIEPSARTAKVMIESNAGEAAVAVSFVFVKDKPNTPPELAVNSTPAETEKNSILIEGVTSVGATVTINGSPATVDSSGKIKASVALKPGVNTIRIVAEKDGLTAEKTLSIFSYIKITLQIDNKTMYVGEASQTLASAPTSSSPPLPKDLSGSTYMPIRPVAEALFSKVGWNGVTSKVTLTQNTPDGKQKVIELWIGKKQAKINGVDQWIDSKQKLYPANVGGKTMLPLRFTANALGAQVDFDSATKTITMKYPMR